MNKIISFTFVLQEKNMDKKLGESLSGAPITPNILDESTGELYDITRHVVKEPNFFKVYIQDISLLYSLSHAQSKTFIAICQLMDFQNSFQSNKSTIDNISVKTKLKKETIKNCITDLKRYGLIFQAKTKTEEVRGCYYVNPNIVSKSSWDSLCKIVTKIEYMPGSGKTMVTEFIPIGRKVDTTKGLSSYQQLMDSDMLSILSNSKTIEESENKFIRESLGRILEKLKEGDNDCNDKELELVHDMIHLVKGNKTYEKIKHDIRLKYGGLEGYAPILESLLKRI